MPIRTLLLLLLVLAFLSAAAMAQSNCCSCNTNGTNCSACCWPDQQANCITFILGTAPVHCGCYCDPLPGDGGGGSGGAGCFRLNSQTTIMGADGRSGVEPKAHQLGGGLLNPGKRRDGTYNFEEWALVSSEGAVFRASRVEFGEKVLASAERYRPREKGGASATLVIEDAAHPSNGREIPLPKVEPIDIDADYPASLAGQEIWFRVEVGKDGVVDQVLLLNVPDDLVAGRFATELHLLNGELGKALRLRRADKGRHRAVVFGLLRANLEGHLVLARSRVLLPKCCCNGSRCA
jgi:hypothetical protein